MTQYVDIQSADGSPKPPTPRGSSWTTDAGRGQGRLRRRKGRERAEPRAMTGAPLKAETARALVDVPVPKIRLVAPSSHMRLAPGHTPVYAVAALEEHVCLATASFCHGQDYCQPQPFQHEKLCLQGVLQAQTAKTSPSCPIQAQILSFALPRPVHGSFTACSGHWWAMSLAACRAPKLLQRREHE